LFGPNYRYWDGPGGARYCFNIEPTFRCPHDGLRYDVVELGTGKVTVTELRPRDETVGITFSIHVTDEAKAAADLLGVDPLKLTRMLARSHNSNHGRERVNGKLTDRCKACGAKMERLGFRVWIERPKTEEELTAQDRTSSHVAERLGFSGERTVTVRSAYTDTKREAKQWCLDERATAQAVAEEETG
jgi:hypothetical protein